MGPIDEEMEMMENESFVPSSQAIESSRLILIGGGVMRPKRSSSVSTACEDDELIEITLRSSSPASLSVSTSAGG